MHKSHKDDSQVIWVSLEEHENPINWPKSRKYFTTLALCGFSFLVSGSSSGYAAPGAEADLIEQLNTSSTLFELGLGIYVIGYALGPLFLAPFSELVGRYRVYVVSYFIFMCMFITISLSPTITGVVLGRLISGLAASTGSTLVGGSIADIFDDESRGIPMSMFSMTALQGAGIFPLCFSWMMDKGLGYQWIEYVELIAAFVWFFFIISMGETRASAVLNHKAKKLRKKTGDQRYIAKTELKKPSFKELMTVSLMRPLHILFTEPIVIAFSLWMGFAWFIFYSIISSIGHIFQTQRDWSPGSIGLLYITFVLGLGLGGIANYFLQERLYQKKRTPEARLYLAMVGGVCLPIGCFIYSWCSYSFVHWIGQAVGLTVILFSIYIIYNTSFAYMSDAYRLYASSAISAQNVFRNLMGGTTPLYITRWYDSITGFNWTSCIIAIIAAILGVVPFILFKYGKKIRQKSQFSNSIAEYEARERKMLGLDDSSEQTVKEETA
ncbi:hypothetical protein E3P99_01067 [Wallemia hederae]|uniref:Major facilitator superfamily (MFS) profile domain-containing protein n=1 Tax=Wallemia hederae TaxID=1540922 RepID=A0A4T0FWP0_9BASI|nr:hypothetical protein E3P99_01067 [Wallemia hederae]